MVVKGSVPIYNLGSSMVSKSTIQQPATVSIAVNWELTSSDPQRDVFDDSQEGEYVYTAVLDGNEYTLAPGVAMPTIQVTVLDIQNLLEPMSIDGVGAKPEYEKIEVLTLSGDVNETHHFIVANGFELTIEAGSVNADHSSISYVDGEGSRQYFKIVSGVLEFSATKEEQDFSNYSIIGGATDEITSHNTRVIMTGGKVRAIFGGGLFKSNASEVASTYVEVSGGTVGNVYGGGFGLSAVVRGGTLVAVKGGAVTESVYGGGAYSKVEGSSEVFIEGAATVGQSVYGGNGNALMGSTPQNESYIKGNTSVTIVGTPNIVGSVYGGGITDVINGSVSVKVNGGTIGGNVFGSGERNRVEQNSSVSIAGGTVAGDVFGGGRTFTLLGVVYENYLFKYIPGMGTVDINISGGTVKGSVYGGGLTDYDAGTVFVGKSVLGNVNIVMTNGTVENSIVGSSLFADLPGELGAITIPSIGVPGNISIEVYGGGVKDIIGIGASRSWEGVDSSDLRHNVFVFVDANVTINGAVYNQMYQKMDSDDTMGETTMVLENSAIPVGEKPNEGGGDSAVSIEDITQVVGNILRLEKQDTWSQSHWRIRGKVHLPLSVTAAVSIVENQELYMPEGTELVVSETTETVFQNRGYIITKQDSLDNSIETDNVPGESNLQSRIYRGDAQIIMNLQDANYTQGQVAVALNASNVPSEVWSFLASGNKVDSAINYTWQQDNVPLSGVVNARYTPSTSEVGTNIYRASATTTHTFESVPSGVLANLQAQDEATIEVRAPEVVPEPEEPDDSSSTVPPTDPTPTDPTPTDPTPTDPTPTDPTPPVTPPTVDPVPPDDILPPIPVPDDDTEEELPQEPEPSTSQDNSNSESTAGTVTPPGEGGNPPSPSITPEGGVSIAPLNPGVPPDAVILDGVVLEADSYILDENGVLTLTPDFLATLGDGDHTLRVRFGDEEFESTIITENGVPLSAGDFVAVGGSWSLFDLLITVLAIVSPVVYFLLVVRKKRKESNLYTEHEQEEQEQFDKKKKRQKGVLVFSILAGIGLVLLLLFTQDFTQPMVFFDNYSIWFALAFLLQTIGEIVFHNHKEKNQREQWTHAPSA